MLPSQCPFSRIPFFFNKVSLFHSSFICSQFDSLFWRHNNLWLYTEPWSIGAMVGKPPSRKSHAIYSWNISKWCQSSQKRPDDSLWKHESLENYIQHFLWLSFMAMASCDWDWRYVWTLSLVLSIATWHSAKKQEWANGFLRETIL